MGLTTECTNNYTAIYIQIINNIHSSSQAKGICTAYLKVLNEFQDIS